MPSASSLEDSWRQLPAGARAAIEQQWRALAAGGLPCGAAIVDAAGAVIAAGRNHAYAPAGTLETRRELPLQHTPLAHAELNALALLATGVDTAALTLWTTQHPCAMCAAAVRFIGIGQVGYIADDPSDHAPRAAIEATQAGVTYRALGSPRWWTICNLLFLYNSAVQRGPEAGNLRSNRDRYPQLVQLALELARGDSLGREAREGVPLLRALAPRLPEIARAARDAASA